MYDNEEHYDRLLDQMEESYENKLNSLAQQHSEDCDDLTYEISHWQNMYTALDHEHSLTETGNQISRANILIKALVFKGSYGEQVKHAQQLDGYITDYLPELAAELRDK